MKGISKNDRLIYESLVNQERLKGEGEIEIVSNKGELEEISRHRLNNSKSTVPLHDSNGLGIVFEDEYIIVVRDGVRFPSGKLGTYLRIIERSSLDGVSGVVMLPIRNEEIFLVESFRHPTQSWEIELPRGFRPVGLSPEQAIHQEINEEIGLSIKKTVDLGFINSNSGLLAGKTQAFLIELNDGNPRPRPEFSEAFRKIRQLPWLKLQTMIGKGEIRDSFTLATLQLAQSHGLI